MKDHEPLIPAYGGYRKLKSYRMAQLICDVTALCCSRYAGDDSRPCERMMQMARNAAQKIAEGSKAGESSKKAELKLTNEAHASLEGLRRDYESFLRHQELPVWEPDDPRRTELMTRRPRNLDDVAAWMAWVDGESTSNGSRGQGEIQNSASTPPIGAPETMANGALTLISMAFSLLDRQTSAQKRVVDHEANLAERLRRRRLADWPE